MLLPDAGNELIQLIQIGDPDRRRRLRRRHNPLALLLLRFLFSPFCSAAITCGGPGDLLATMRNMFVRSGGGD
jgi:hypothetical protein